MQKQLQVGPQDFLAVFILAHYKYQQLCQVGACIYCLLVLQLTKGNLILEHKVNHFCLVFNLMCFSASWLQNQVLIFLNKICPKVKQTK